MSLPEHTRPHVPVPAHERGGEPGHAHGHPHVHEHLPTAGAELPHRPQAGAVLDIGGSIGALLVHCPEPLEGAEIQLFDPHGHNVTHTQVHRRHVGGGGGGGGGPVMVSWSGLFPGLAQGEYLLEVVPGRGRHRVRVLGGQVTRVDAR